MNLLQFIVNNNFTKVINPQLASMQLNQYLTIKNDTFYRGLDFKELAATGRKVIKTKYHQEQIPLYNFFQQIFPTGRLGYILDDLDKTGVPYDVIDERIKPEPKYSFKYIGPPSDGSNGFPPRLYQLKAPSLIYEYTRGVLWYATASGKTITAARIITHLKVKTLYMVPSLELLNQTYEDFCKNITNAKIGKIGDGDWNPQEITIATTATLWSRFETQECKDFLATIELLIIDEIHHVTVKDNAGNKLSEKEPTSKVNTWYNIAISCPAYYRVGLTGTPGKDIEQKRALLECAIGRVIDRVSTKELIDLGIISDVEVHLHKVKHSTTQSDYHLARKEGVLNNKAFNEYIVNIAISELLANKNVLLLTNSKSTQGPMLVKLFKEKGWNIPFITGEEKRANRLAARQDFKEGRIKCLIGTIYKEGVDFPKCDCGILCDGGYDEKGTIQFLGRILRKGKESKLARLHDFLHNDKKYLKKHSDYRMQTYIEEELDKIHIHEGITV